MSAAGASETKEKGKENAQEAMHRKVSKPSPLPALEGLSGSTLANALRQHQATGVKLSGYQRWVVYWNGKNPCVGAAEGCDDLWEDADYGAQVDAYERQDLKAS